MECVGVPGTAVQASAAEASISVNINININMNIAASMLPSKSPPSTWHPPAHSVVDPACQHRIVDVEDCPRPRGFIQPLRREHPQPLLRWRPTIVIPFPLATAGVCARMFATHRAAAALSSCVTKPCGTQPLSFLLPLTTAGVCACMLATSQQPGASVRIRSSQGGRAAAPPEPCLGILTMLLFE
jgi:hypothetical protein